MESLHFSEELQEQAFTIFRSDDIKPMETLFSFLYSNQEPQTSQAYNLLLCGKHHHPHLLFIKLLFVVRYAKDFNTRINCAQVLKSIKVQDLWPKLSPFAQIHAKNHILDFIRTEDSMPLLRTFCGFVSELVGQIYKCNDEWKGFLEFLVESLVLGIEKFQEIALLVFAGMPNDCRRIICEVLFPFVQFLEEGLLRALNSRNLDVTVAAFGAGISLMHLFSSYLCFEKLRNLFRMMLGGVMSLLRNNEEKRAQKGLQELTKLVTEVPQILKPYVNGTIWDMISIIEIHEDETKSYAVHFLMIMLEAKDLAPELQSLPSECMVELFNLPLRMLLCIQEDSVEDDFRRKTDTYSYGVKFLNQMSIAFGEKNIVPIAFKLLPTYMNAHQWQRRHAGITVLAVISKECSAEMILMENYLKEAVDMILKSFHDPHPRVCRAAFHLMQLATDMVGAIQILYHQRIVPALVAALDKKQYSKVEEEAVSAVLSFVRKTSKDCLAMFVDLDNLLRKLLVLLEGNNKSARCRATILQIFSVVASQLPGVCPKYCTHFLPFLLQACNDPDLKLKKEGARGIQICAEFGGDHFRPFAKSALHSLGNVVTYSDKSCIDRLKASDIAVGAIGKIFEFHRDLIHAEKLGPAWLSLLPIKVDLDVAKIVHEQICTMAERADWDLLGSNYEFLHKIVAVFLEVISEGISLARVETSTRMKNFVKLIWREFPKNMLDIILSSLSAKQRDVLATELGFTP